MRRGTPALRKRQFISVVKNTINDCLKIFGYSKQPRIFETRFDSYAIMMFVEGQRHGESAIYYDYQKFQTLFRDCDDADRVYRLIHIVAHEMRHYYQFRQLTAKSRKRMQRLFKSGNGTGLFALIVNTMSISVPLENLMHIHLLICIWQSVVK